MRRSVELKIVEFISFCLELHQGFLVPKTNR